MAIVMTLLSFLPVYLGIGAGPRRTVLFATQVFVVGMLVLARVRGLPGRGHGAVVVATFLLVGTMGTTAVGLLGGPAVAFVLAVVTAGVLGGRRAAIVTALIASASTASVGVAMLNGFLPAPVPDEILPTTATAWLRSGSLSLLLTLLVGALVVWVVEHLETVTVRLAVESERRREAEIRAHEAQRVQLIGELAAGLAHDVNNHLNVIAMWVGMLSEPDNDVEISEGADAIAASVQQAAMLTQQMLVLGHRGVRAPSDTSLSELLVDFHKTVGRVLPRGIDVALEVEPDLWVHADASQLQQVVLNLCMNARDAMPDGGRLLLRARASDASPATPDDASPAAGWVCLEVVDNGVGMDAATARRAAEPFFTTKARGEGTGLGLATTASIVEASGGRMTLESALGAGTTVRLWFPRVPPGPQVATAPARSTAPIAGARVLVAEDSVLLLRAQVHALTGAGATVVTASDGDEAMVRLAEGHFDALCTDAVMPGRSVQSVIEAFMRLNPGSPVLLCSGYVEEELLRRGIESGDFRCLAKPFAAADLVAALAEELAGRR